MARPRKLPRRWLDGRHDAPDCMSTLEHHEAGHFRNVGVAAGGRKCSLVEAGHGQVTVDHGGIVAGVKRCGLASFERRPRPIQSSGEAALHKPQRPCTSGVLYSFGSNFGARSGVHSGPRARDDPAVGRAAGGRRRAPAGPGSFHQVDHGAYRPHRPLTWRNGAVFEAPVERGRRADRSRTCLSAVHAGGGLGPTTGVHVVRGAWRCAVFEGRGMLAEPNAQARMLLRGKEVQNRARQRSHR